MNNDIFRLDGKVVAITGGMGQLGRQFCSALLQRGANVAVLDLCAKSEERLGWFGGLSEHPGLLLIECDVTRKSMLLAALDEIKRVWEVPFGLINGAALDSPPNASAAEAGPFETYPESFWDRVLEVNTKGVFLCCQVFGGAMAEARRGSIVNIGSIYGLVSPDQRIYGSPSARGKRFVKPVAYSASKSALSNLTRYLATYWGPLNVRVNLLSFGGVFNGQDSAFVDAYSSRVPLGRMAQEEEYNGAVVFLLSDASSYMTGAGLTIDGGWTAW